MSFYISKTNRFLHVGILKNNNLKGYAMFYKGHTVVPPLLVICSALSGEYNGSRFNINSKYYL